jgi:dihydroflavonol-4-reductase
MDVFVTGGNGFIGSAVVRRLVDRGHAVRCLLRPASDTARIRGLPWERVEGDVRDPAAVRRGLDGCGAVVHLASVSSWAEIDSPLLKDVTVGGTRNVLGAAAALGRPRVVFVSSTLAVNGSRAPRVFDETAEWTLPDRGLGYADAKRAAEALCRAAGREGVPVVIVNPAEVYGPDDTALVTAGNLIDFWKSNPVFVCRGGTSVVHVEDVAEGIVRALERGAPGQRYILGGENLDVRALAALALDLFGLRRRVVTLPNGLIRAVARAGLRLGLPLPFNPRVIPYATRYWFVDAAKARRELGATFRPARDTLAATIDWLKRSGRLR